MTIAKIYAQIACADTGVSEPWYESLFGRAADAHPMDHLAEWHHGDGAGMQLFAAPDNAGHGTLTLIVSDLAAEHTRLDGAGLSPGAIEQADYVSLIRLSDPDGNLVVLAEPRG